MVAGHLVITLTSQKFFVQKSRADLSQGLLAIIVQNLLFSKFAIEKYKHLDIQNYNFTLFCMSVKLGLSLQGRNIG